MGIKTGADYGLLWAANMLREPYKKLPYLFFYGGEDCGKSTYHEAFEFLMTKGSSPLIKLSEARTISTGSWRGHCGRHRGN